MYVVCYIRLHIVYNRTFYHNHALLQWKWASWSSNNPNWPNHFYTWHSKTILINVIVWKRWFHWSKVLKHNQSNALTEEGKRNLVDLLNFVHWRKISWSTKFLPRKKIRASMNLFSSMDENSSLDVRTETWLEEIDN